MKTFFTISYMALSMCLSLVFVFSQTLKTKEVVIYNDQTFEATANNAGKPDIKVMTLRNEVFLNGTEYELLPYNPVDASSVPGIAHIKRGEYKGFKAYEYANAINNKHSEAYKLKEQCTVNEEGFLTYEDRYLVALGTYFDAPVGTLVDIKLENGEIIPAVVGDIKSDQHTDLNNIYSMGCICATEFIVDKSFKVPTGDVSDFKPEWDSKVISIIVY